MSNIHRGPGATPGTLQGLWSLIFNSSLVLHEVIVPGILVVTALRADGIEGIPAVVVEVVLQEPISVGANGFSVTRPVEGLAETCAKCWLYRVSR